MEWKLRKRIDIRFRQAQTMPSKIKVSISLIELRNTVDDLMAKLTDKASLDLTFHFPDDVTRVVYRLIFVYRTMIFTHISTEITKQDFLLFVLPMSLWASYHSQRLFTLDFFKFTIRVLTSWSGCLVQSCHCQHGLYVQSSLRGVTA